jgi:alpha-1,3-mannosyltransferase
MPGMKRVQTIAIEVLVLLCVCALLGRQYFNHHSQSSVDRQRHEIDAGLNNATAEDPLEAVPTPPSRTANNETGDEDRWAVQITTTSLVAATTTQTQYTWAVEATSPVETPVKRPDAPFLTSNEDGDPKLLREAPRYLQAIMNPFDTSFPRLSCPVPTHNRYNYLKPTPSSTSPKPKYFFALDLYACAPLLPRLLGSIIETIRFLGPSNCELSIVEGRSHDGTYEILHSLIPELAALNVTYHFTTNTIDPKAGSGVDRVEALAILRNQALHPLSSSPESYSPDTTVLFINDVALCMEDILELIHQRILQHADMTCAMDWIYGGATFYDVWVSRALNGDQFFEIPQSGSWEFADNLFWNHPASKEKWEAKKPFQAFACWNGATAFTAKPILEQKIKFRTVKRGKGKDGKDDECYMGEPTLFCKDMWHEGYGRITVVPSVNVGYDDEESKKVKQTHGRTGEWVEREAEMRGERDRDALIVWEAEPPPVVKCVPTYQRPVWVPWDQGLKEKEKDEGKMVG